MTSDEILMDGEERMEKAADHLKDELRGLRTGRATPALVDGLRVEYYGSPTPLKQLAQISTPDPQSILIKPYDQSVLKEVEKAIRARRWRRASRSSPRRPRSPSATSAATPTRPSTRRRRPRR